MQCDSYAFVPKDLNVDLSDGDSVVNIVSSSTDLEACLQQCVSLGEQMIVDCEYKNGYDDQRPPVDHSPQIVATVATLTSNLYRHSKWLQKCLVAASTYLVDSGKLMAAFAVLNGRAFQFGPVIEHDHKHFNADTAFNR